jgi:tetratricopeptide (TPR) repeat protein
MDNSKDKEDIYLKIDAYIKGSLNEKQKEELWVEFAKNPDLLDQLELEVGVKKILADSAKKKSTTKVHTLPDWVWHASAAAVILLVALVQLFRVDTPTELEDFLVANIPSEQLETANGIRDSDVVITSADSLLNLGFAATSAGNDSKAIELFSEVITSYNEEPYASKAYLNIGILNYNAGSYEEAIISFEQASERAKENRMISEKAFWYLGNAYVNVGKLQKGLVAVGEAYQRDGVFRKPAFVLYQKLNYELGNIDPEDAE